MGAGLDRWPGRGSRARRVPRVVTRRARALRLGVAALAVPLLLAATAPAGELLPGAEARQAVHPGTPARSSAEPVDLITPARYSVPQAMLDNATIDGVFAPYYDAHAGLQLLGRPLTPALPTADGLLVQFFEAGALALPIDRDRPGRVQPTGGAQGHAASESDVVWLPLLDDLLRLGSTAPVAGDDSSLTYADLRRAIRAASHTPVGGGFSERQSAGVANAGGDDVPTAIWAYITRADVSPDGWDWAFGTPLTGPLPVVSASPGVLRSGTVQVFARGAVFEDDATGDDGQPLVERLRTGVAYLETVGLPEVTVPQGSTVWTAKDTALVPQPGAAAEGPHLGANFALRLTGDARWLDGALWYAAAWHAGHAGGIGWVAAADVTHAPPAAGQVASAGFDVLSPELFAYLQQHGDAVGAMVYDITDDIYYGYNPHGQFTVASSVKVPIMLTFLTTTESQGREPSDGELALLTAMIEQSDNDAAQALWDESGGGLAVQAFLQAHDIADFSPDLADGWGWSTISPAAMVTLLTLLNNGQVLTPGDRALALSLMSNVEPDQQIGVGDTAPAGASVALKDGWVPGPDGLWVMNSSGIVTAGNATYIVSVYSQHLDTLEDGWEIVRHVCGGVAQTLA